MIHLEVALAQAKATFLSSYLVPPLSVISIDPLPKSIIIYSPVEVLLSATKWPD